MSDKFPQFPIHTFGEDFETSRQADPEAGKVNRLFWLALAGCTLVPIAYSAFLLFLATR